MNRLPIQFLVSDPNDFRDKLPSSGVFDLMDCNVNIESNLHISLEEIERYLTILKACVNVVDIEFTTNILSNIGDNELLITVYEIPIHVAENRPPLTPMGKGPVKKMPQVKRAPTKPLDEDEDFLDI